MASHSRVIKFGYSDFVTKNNCISARCLFCKDKNIISEKLGTTSNFVRHFETVSVWMRQTFTSLVHVGLGLGLGLISAGLGLGLGLGKNLKDLDSDSDSASARWLGLGLDWQGLGLGLGLGRRRTRYKSGCWCFSLFCVLHTVRQIWSLAAVWIWPSAVMSSLNFLYAVTLWT